MDPMNSIGLLSNSSPLKESQNIVYRFRFHLVTILPATQVDSTDCTSDLIFLLDSGGLQPQVLSTGIWLRVLDMYAVLDSKNRIDQ